MREHLQAEKRGRRLFPASVVRWPALPRILGRWHGRERKEVDDLFNREGRRSGNVPEPSSMQWGWGINLCGSLEKMDGVREEGR